MVNITINDFLGGIIVILFIFQSVPHSVMLDWLGIVRMPDPVFMLKFVFDVLIGRLLSC